MKHRVSNRLDRARDPHGFTLVELLVGMAAGLIVASGLFTVLDVTLRQSTRTFSRIDATQRARVALGQIGNLMHSACLEDQVRPIEAGSSGSNVTFVSAYGTAVNPTPLFHKVAFDSGASTLTDTTYTATGNAPNWNPGTSIETKTLLTDVAQSSTTPVFRYFQSSASGQVQIKPDGSALVDQNEAETVTEVRMTLVVKPTGGGANLNSGLTPNTVTDSTVLRLTPIPNPGNPGKDFYPCA